MAATDRNTGDGCRKALVLSDMQSEAVSSVMHWLRDWHDETYQVDQVFRLFGYAGTGKTTIARHIASVAQSEYEGVVGFAAFTGKAASVLTAKGCPARTIHSILYKPIKERDPITGKETGVVTFQPKDTGTAKSLILLVIDECSMVGEKIGNDLLAIGIPILVLGDPAQLPSIGDGGFFTDGEPDVLLTEVHRQAEGSGVLDLATKIRQGFAVDGYYGDSAVLPMRELQSIDWLSFEQIICGTNSRRVMWNRMVREKLGFRGPIPVRGERVICCRNNHKLKLLNGEQFLVADAQRLDQSTVRLWIYRENDPDPESVQVDSDDHFFEGGSSTDAPSVGEDFCVFDFAYAITCHKSQGSQWRSVLVIDESRVFRNDAQRWIYTAVTRACDHVVVLR